MSCYCYRQRGSFQVEANIYQYVASVYGPPYQLVDSQELNTSLTSDRRWMVICEFPFSRARDIINSQRINKHIRLLVLVLKIGGFPLPLPELTRLRLSIQVGH